MIQGFIQEFLPPRYDAEKFGRDFLASVVVFLVALPLCLGIAIASGYPPAAGLISGIIGGLIVATLSGCALQVSGPAAGLIALVWEGSQRFGLEGMGVIVMAAGIVQLTMGGFGLGQLFRAVSPAVIQGMLAGIGVLIFGSQFHVMVDDTPQSKGIDNLISIPDAIVKGIFPLDGSSHHLAAGIGLITILTVIIWNLVPSKLRIVPAPLVAVIVAVAASSLLQLPINYVEIPDNFFDSVQLPQWGNFGVLLEHDAILMVLTIAFIASAETLLTATAVDQMTTRCRTDYNREVVAQGAGNFLAGLVGAIPITGVIVRSSVNVLAGAESRVSGILHGIWILLFVLALPFVLGLIPVSALAAILVYTGYKLVNPKAIRELAAYGKSEVVIYGVTLVAIVMTNLLEGVIIGLILASLKLFHSYAFLETEQEFVEEGSREVVLHVKGYATFVTLPSLASALESLPPDHHVTLDFQKVYFMDMACHQLVEGWKKRYSLEGGEVVVRLSDSTNEPNGKIAVGVS